MYIEEKYFSYMGLLFKTDVTGLLFVKNEIGSWEPISQNIKEEG